MTKNRRPRLATKAREERVFSRLHVVTCSFREASHGGGERDRTDDLLLAKQALSQLSYGPVNGGSGWI